MAATVVVAGTSSPCIRLYGLSSKKAYITALVKRGGSRRRGNRNLGHLTEIVRKDMDIMKNGIGRGLEWVNEAFRMPKILKTVDDFVWHRNLEYPCATGLPPPWPRPS